MDCTVHACSATTPLQTFRVNIALPAGQTVTALTLLVGYRSDLVSIPGSGADTSVAGRFKNRPSNTVFAAFDLDYAVRTVLGRSAGFASGRIFTIDFDSCSGASAATPADFGCSVVGCANGFGDVSDCVCTVSVP